MIRLAGRAFLAAIAAMVVLVAAAFGWVAIYSYLIKPGQSMEHYNAYAQQASPWVAMALGMPVFYGACRWIARTRNVALAAFAVHCAIEVPVLAVSDLSHLPVWFLPVIFALKFCGCYLGGRK